MRLKYIRVNQNKTQKEGGACPCYRSPFYLLQNPIKEIEKTVIIPKTRLLLTCTVLSFTISGKYITLLFVFTLFNVKKTTRHVCRVVFFLYFIFLQKPEEVLKMTTTYINLINPNNKPRRDDKRPVVSTRSRLPLPVCLLDAHSPPSGDA